MQRNALQLTKPTNFKPNKHKLHAMLVLDIDSEKQHEVLDCGKLKVQNLMAVCGF